MSEHRTERVIEGAARPELGRLGVAAVVVVSFLLAAIVGMTSAASPWLADDGTGPSPPAIVGQLLAVALAVGICVLLGLIWIHESPRAKAKRKKRKAEDAAVALAGAGSGVRAGSFVLIGGIAVVVLLVVAFWSLFEQANVAQPPLQPAPSIGNADPLPPDGPSPTAPAAVDWFLFALVASVVVGLPLALVARRRRRVTEPEPEQEDVPESVVRAVGESIDQIERDPDARRAIIRAYARMEHAFDDAGIPRRPYETPFEYLGRALRGLRVSPPIAGRLAALFERARFSQHGAGMETKHEAIGALREIERQLQGPSA